MTPSIPATSCGRRLVAATALATCLAAAASAQVTRSAPPEPEPGWEMGQWMGEPPVPGAPGPDDPTVDPSATHPQAWVDRIAALPAFTGVWTVKDEVPIGVFDPATAHRVHDGQPGTDFGIAPGGRMFPPYTPEAEAYYEERIALAVEQNFNDDYVSYCRPQGYPRMWATPGTIEIIVLPDVVYWLHSYFGNQRRIYTDGREFPPPEQTFPQDMGFSVGRWEGDELVVETRYMMAGHYDQSGAPYSDDLVITERTRMLQSGDLETTMVLEDPGVLAEPWTVTRILAPTQDAASRQGTGPTFQNVIGNYCSDNRNIADASGNQTLHVPGEANVYEFRLPFLEE